jgi:hypothetical protein
VTHGDMKSISIATVATILSAFMRLQDREKYKD